MKWTPKIALWNRARSWENKSTHWPSQLRQSISGARGYRKQLVDFLCGVIEPEAQRQHDVRIGVSSDFEPRVNPESTGPALERLCKEEEKRCRELAMLEPDVWLSAVYTVMRWLIANSRELRVAIIRGEAEEPASLQEQKDWAKKYLEACEKYNTEAPTLKQIAELSRRHSSSWSRALRNIYILAAIKQGLDKKVNQAGLESKREFWLKVSDNIESKMEHAAQNIERKRKQVVSDPEQFSEDQVIRV